MESALTKARNAKQKVLDAVGDNPMVGGVGIAFNRAKHRYEIKVGALDAVNGVVDLGLPAIIDGVSVVVDFVGEIVDQ